MDRAFQRLLNKSAGDQIFPVCEWPTITRDIGWKFQPARYSPETASEIAAFFIAQRRNSLWLRQIIVMPRYNVAHYAHICARRAFRAHNLKPVPNNDAAHSRISRIPQYRKYRVSTDVCIFCKQYHLISNNIGRRRISVATPTLFDRQKKKKGDGNEAEYTKQTRETRAFYSHSILKFSTLKVEEILHGFPTFIGM